MPGAIITEYGARCVSGERHGGGGIDSARAYTSAPENTSILVHTARHYAELKKTKTALTTNTLPRRRRCKSAPDAGSNIAGYLAAYRSGKKVREIADCFGVSPAAVSKALLRYGGRSERTPQRDRWTREGEHYFLVTARGKVLIDACDLPLVEGRTVVITGKGHATVALVEGRKRIGFLARIILNADPTLLVDHINCDSFDNRRANLRLCTHGENMRNRRKFRTGSSQYKGVRLSGKSWLATISHDHRQIYLGSFGTEEQAARAYDEAARGLHGEFARLNFPRVGERSALFPDIYTQ